jgi:hypothetical protein
MADTNQKADLLRGLGLTDDQIEALTGQIDNSETADITPFVTEVQVYKNAKAKLVFPERVVFALGGNTQFQHPTLSDTMQVIKSRGSDPGNTEPTVNFDYQNPESFVSLESLRPRGGRKIIIPTKDYTWNGRTNNSKVTWRVPAWITIVAIQNALFTCIKDNPKKPKTFKTGTRRLYFVQDTTEQMKDQNTVDF